MYYPTGRPRIPAATGGGIEMNHDEGPTGKLIGWLMIFACLMFWAVVYFWDAIVETLTVIFFE